MKTRFTWLGIVATIIAGVGLFFAGCNGDVNSVVLYHGQVVYINTTTPFADLTVKVTDGQNTHCQTQTDAGGLFSLKVRVDEIDGSYYLLAGDSTCVPKKVALGGFGQAEVDLGVIEVEGPALPTVVTTPIQSVTADEAVLGGEVQTDGRLAVTARGVCYGTEVYPTVNGLHTTDGTGLGSFTSNLKELEHNTIYYVRAYATNSLGTAYGEQVKFTTEEGVPVVITDSVYRITAHTARCKGHVESDGGYQVTKRGTCWSKHPDPTTDDDFTDEGSGLGEFTCSLKDLTEDTKYYVRTFATNNTATVYGEQIIITTLDGLPVVRTDSIVSVTATGFTAYGTVVSDCDIPVTARGFCYSTTQYPTIEDAVTTVGKGLGAYQSNIKNLEVGTTYYVRAYATNATSTTYSEQIKVETTDGLPSVQTINASSSTATSITVNCEVIANGGFDVTERGVCYSSSNLTPTIEDEKKHSGKNNGKYSVTITDLSAGSSYYVRAYAINANGSSYGEAVNVVTLDGAGKITLNAITDVTALTASAEITIKDAGGATIQNSGICWSINPNPTIVDSTSIASGHQLNTTYVCNMSGLQPNTNYYVRAFVTTEITTTYSAQLSFQTNSGLPIVSTGTTNATSVNITSEGTITSDGGYSITARGLCYSTTNSNPTIEDTYTTAGIGMGFFTSVITDVAVNTTYYVRAYASNSIGTGYGETITVTTGNGLPVVTTTEVGENVTSSTAISGGQVTDDGGYPIIVRGVCWSTLPLPTIDDEKTTDGEGTGFYSSIITGISWYSNNIYYIRAYATNVNGTSYGEEITITKETYEYTQLPSISYSGYVYKIYPDMGAMTWYAATDACENLVYGGYDDWYLPNSSELSQIMNLCTSGWKTTEGSNFTPILAETTGNITYQSAYYWASDQRQCYYLSVSYTKGSKKYHVHQIRTTDGSGLVLSLSSLYRVRPVRKFIANQ